MSAAMPPAIVARKRRWPSEIWPASAPWARAAAMISGDAWMGPAERIGIPAGAAGAAGTGYCWRNVGSGIQSGAPSYQTWAVCGNEPSRTMLCTASRGNGPSCCPLL
jgi:hypothetical protein